MKDDYTYSKGKDGNALRQGVVSQFFEGHTLGFEVERTESIHVLGIF